ncbi:MAG: STAS domain-containing protein [Betaproteobacteria bacterium]|nr:STAS domain-containing protein [Betaproteobacteria bacterium]
MRVESGIAFLDGDLTLPQATRLLAECEQAYQSGIAVFDLSGAGALDSSAISLMLSLRRNAAGRPLEFRNIPDGLVSLARLYGVVDHF